MIVGATFLVAVTAYATYQSKPLHAVIGAGMFGLGFLAVYAWQWWTIAQFDKGFNISIQPLQPDRPPKEQFWKAWSLTEVAAVTGALTVVRNRYRGAGSQPGLTKKQIDAIKTRADGEAFNSVLDVFRRALAGVLITNSEGKGRDGVEESFVGGNYTGVRWFGAWITRLMHRFGIAILFGLFIAIVMSMDVIEGTTATVMNLSGLSGGSTVIVAGPGMKSLGRTPDIYADVITTHIPAHEIENFQSHPLNTHDGVVHNLTRISQAIGREFENMEVPAGLESAALLEIERRIFKLRGDLASIGEIDEALMKEATETESRYEFLKKESADLDQAVKDLKQLIKELSGKIREEFGGSMSKINEEFGKFFELMFGGGHAKLKIVKREIKAIEEDGEEAPTLATGKVGVPTAARVGTEEIEEVEEEGGVEIELRLPRKKVNSLEMLSGGERSLVGIAAIFALISVSPPPFLVLDEIDAALDERNAHRFSDMLKEFSKKTQFVVVTHNRATMEAADILYGVTLNDDGTSKILSLKLE